MMSIPVAFLLFVLLILIYIFISEIFTVLFRLTGLNEEKARFQVVSLLTNSGFTTRESELIAASSRRRRLARTVMLFGYTFTVTIVSALVNIFLAFKLTEIRSILWAMPWPLLILLALFLLYKNKRVHKAFGNLIERIASRIMYLKDVNHLLLLDHFGDMVMARVFLRTLPESLKGKALAESGLRERFNLLVILNQRQGTQVSAASGDTVLQAGDCLVVFGPEDSIYTAFEINRPSGWMEGQA